VSRPAKYCGAVCPAARVAEIDIQRVLQYQTRPEFNTDYDALEVGLEKRLANREG
jgi:hypothetical protein